MSKILTFEDRIAMEKEAIENEKRIIEDALPYIFDKLIRSPRAIWTSTGRLHSITVPMEGGTCRTGVRRSWIDTIAKLLNEQLVLEKNVYLKYPKVDFCSLEQDGGNLVLEVFFEKERFSHID
jgi:hypothetical protein